MAESNTPDVVELSLEDLEGVAGGTVYRFTHQRRGIQKWDLRCYKCGSSNVPLSRTDFSSFEEAQRFLTSTRVTCGNCGLTDFAAVFVQTKAR